MADVVVKNTTEWRDFMLRNASNRNPDIDVGPDSLPWVWFSTLAEALAVQSLNALTLGRSVPIANMTEAQLHTTFDAILPQQGESYATGWVTIQTAAAGTTIQVGDLLTDNDNKQSYRFSGATNTAYVNGDQVPIISVDPGKGVNLEAGKMLTWSALRPGCYATATVWAQPDGTGVSGGRDQETIDEWKSRLSDMKANPAGHGNEQDVITLAEDISGRTLSTGEVTTGHGMPVRKGFCYPALMGVGTLGLAFTVKQDYWWKSRCPSSTQITTVYQYVNAALPKDSILPITVQDEGLSIDVSITLNTRAAQWADFAPWPSAATRGAGRKIIGTVTDATHFTVVTDDADYTSETNPVAGQTIGMLDATTGTMKRKKCLTVTGTGPWIIVVDTTAGASDAAYLPVAGQAVCPWFDAIQDVANAIGEYVATFGPGECVTLDPGDGLRQLRVPLVADGLYPIAPNQSLNSIIPASVPAVVGASFLSASPSTTTVEGLDLANVALLTNVGIYKA